MYRQLDPERIVETTEQLHRRVCERFPGSGLSGVSTDILSVAHDAREKAATVGRPILELRIGLAVGVGVVLAVGAYFATRVSLHNRELSWTEFAQGFDAGLNLIIVLGAAAFSLVTVERRIKRRRALKALYELRVLAHVVEMHQLNKDPERVLHQGPRTPSSPVITMTAFELIRYLGYCSDLLAVIGNLAALYAQRYDDPVALDAVDAIERLSTGISQKIWQKIVIINTALAMRPEDPPPRS